MGTTYDYITSVHRQYRTCGTASYDHDPRVMRRVPFNVQAEIDIEVRGTVLLGVMITRVVADTMRLSYSKGVGIKAFENILHHTVVKLYTRREINYYSHDIFSGSATCR
eukprot:gene14869-17580_t